MKKEVSQSDIQRVEKKIDLLNYKLDRLFEVQGITFERPKELVDKEEQRKRKAREKQQAKELMREHFHIRFEKMMHDGAVKRTFGAELQAKFNLATVPSADRIREYQKTNDPKAFDGLKRNS
jgi:hypothetical protein